MENLRTNELRLGNLIIEDGKETEFNGDFYHWCDDIMKPIPLTDEWFTKFGFQLYGKNDYPNSPNDWYWCKIGFDFSIAYKNKKVQHTNIKVKYVHQLQNLYFALTEGELELSSNVA